jgi:hypothetical protein
VLSIVNIVLECTACFTLYYCYFLCNAALYENGFCPLVKCLEPYASMLLAVILVVLVLETAPHVTLGIGTCTHTG